MGAGTGDPTVTTWEFLNTDRWTMLGKAPCSRHEFVISLRRTPKYEAMLQEIVAVTEAASGIDLISRALGIGSTAIGPKNFSTGFSQFPWTQATLAAKLRCRCA